MFVIGNDEIARLTCTAKHIYSTYSAEQGKRYIQQIKVEPVTDSGSMEKGITENGLQKQRGKKRLH